MWTCLGSSISMAIRRLRPKQNTATRLVRLAVFVFLSFALVVTTTAQTTHPDLATVVYLANGANPTGTQNLTGSHASADTRSAGNAASAIAGGVAGAVVNAATGSTQSANQAGRGSSGAGGGSSVQGRSAGVQAVAAQTANIAGVQAGNAIDCSSHHQQRSLRG